MADYYLAHGEYTYSATPTWGVAQDGDGKGTSAAVPATASVNFTGVSATSNSFGIMGVTLTVSGSGTTLASAVVTAVNASSSAVNSGSSPGLHQLRDMVFARVSGTDANIVEIMTRAGSADLNHTSNTAVAITTAGMTGTPVISQFAGGASGFWGWLFNSSAIWPSAKAAYSYGLVFSANLARPLVGPALTVNDTVHAKANNAVVAVTGTSAINLFITSAIRLLVDDGTVWPGSNGTLTITSQQSSYGAFSLYSSATVFLGARTKHKLIFLYETTGSGNYTISHQAGALYLHNALFRRVDNAGTGTVIVGTTNYHSQVWMYGCRYLFEKNVFTSPIQLSGGNYSHDVKAIDCDFDWTNLAVAAGAAVSVAGYSSDLATMEMLNCRATGAAPMVFGSSSSPGLKLIARNMSGFALGATLVGYLGGNTDPRVERGYALLQSVGASRDFRLESNQSVIDWMSGQGYPTLDAYLPSGLLWSYRMLYSSSANAIRPFDNPEQIALTKTHVSSSAMRTVTLEMLLPDTSVSSITKDHLAMTVTYVDSTGITRTEGSSSAPIPSSGAALLDTSTASWTLNSYSTHLPRKIAVTTAYAVKQNSEIECSLLARIPATSLLTIFINPEIGIA